MLKCGMKEINITPALGNSIPGQIYDRKSSGIKDELYAKALVVDSDGDVVVYIAVDAVGISRPQVEHIRNRVCKFTGISPTNIMISATHTHTGGPVRDGFASVVNERYLLEFADKSADAAITAFHCREEARIGFGKGIEEHISFNRRFFMKDGTFRTNPQIGNPLIDRPAGPIDPEVTVIRIDDAKGAPIGVVTNFACHLDVVKGTEYSADYPGELSSVIKKVLGNHVVSLFMLGACGNINHLDFSGQMEIKPDHYKWMGRVLAGEVLKVREKIETIDTIPAGVKQVNFLVELRHASFEEIQDAQRTVQNTESKEIDLAFARQILKLAESKETSAEIEIQTIQLGDLAIVGLPAEIFVEFGLEIKQKSPFAYTLISEMTNGSAKGYVCTREAFEQGGYEPRLTNNSRNSTESGYEFVYHALQLLNQKDVGSHHD